MDCGTRAAVNHLQDANIVQHLRAWFQVQGLSWVLKRNSDKTRKKLEKKKERKRERERKRRTERGKERGGREGERDREKKRERERERKREIIKFAKHICYSIFCLNMQ